MERVGLLKRDDEFKLYDKDFNVDRIAISNFIRAWVPKRGWNSLYDVTKDIIESKKARTYNLGNVETVFIGYNEAIYINTFGYRGRKIQTDHLNNVFPSRTDMCRHYKLSTDIYLGRIERGWTKEQALTGDAPGFFDHEGNRFSSAKEMYEHWGVKPNIYSQRRILGWTKEQALTGVSPHPIIYQYDHEGRQFSTITEMCKYWGISVATYNGRRRSGWTKKAALTTKLDMSFGEYCIKELLEEMNIEYIYNKNIMYICNLFGLDADALTKSYAKALRDAGNPHVRSTTVKNWRFDFTVKNGKIIGFIEADGDQHFTYVEHFFKTLREFFRRCDVDQAKTGFAFCNGFPLLRLNPKQYKDPRTLRYCLNHFFENPKFYTNGRINPLLMNDEYYAGLREAYPDYVPVNICETMASLATA